MKEETDKFLSATNILGDVFPKPNGTGMFRCCRCLETGSIFTEVTKQKELAKANELKRVETEYMNRANEYMAGMKTKELKRELEKCLIEEYKNERAKVVKTGKTTNVDKCSVNKCLANVCFVGPWIEEEGFEFKWNSIKWNSLRTCGRTCDGKFCKKHNQEVVTGVFGVPRDGVGTDTPFQFPYHFTKYAKESDTKWALAMWRKYPKMNPANTSEMAEEEIPAEELKNMKPEEIKALCESLLIEKYKNERVKVVKAGKTAKVSKSSVNKCPANVCFTDITKNPSPMKDGRNNVFRPCGLKCSEGGEYCKKHEKQLFLSSFKTLRDGAGTETPHDFGECIYIATKKNLQKEWVEHMWKMYPKMNPEMPSEIPSEEIHAEN